MRQQPRDCEDQNIKTPLYTIHSVVCDWLREIPHRSHLETLHFLHFTCKDKLHFVVGKVILAMQHTVPRKSI